jgi:hypothetical protein
MRAHHTTICATLFAVVVSFAGCDAVERARGRFGTTTTDTIVTATGSGLALGLQVPPTLRPGDEGVVRLSLTNLTDTAVANVRLELIMPGWAEPMPPRIGDRPVSMSALADGSTQFAYRMDDAPLAPKQAQTVAQRIRVPTSGASLRGVGAWTRIVRARLLAADGRPLAQVESEIAVDSAAIAVARSGSDTDTAGWRDRLGPVELGMTAAAVRQAAANARDTTWSHEGTRQRGLVFPVANGTALAVLSQDAVTRIEVAHPSIHTAERLGVGSRMAQLRATYGSPCVDASAGRVVVWFATAPGISFAMNTPVPPNPAQLRENPDRILNTAQVTRWWLSRDVETCPN